MIFLFLEPSLALLEAKLPLFKVCLKIEKYSFTTPENGSIGLKQGHRTGLKNAFRGWVEVFLGSTGHN